MKIIRWHAFHIIRFVIYSYINILLKCTCVLFLLHHILSSCVRVMMMMAPDAAEYNTPLNQESAASSWRTLCSLLHCASCAASQRTIVGLCVPPITQVRAMKKVIGINIY